MSKVDEFLSKARALTAATAGYMTTLSCAIAGFAVSFGSMPALAFPVAAVGIPAGLAVRKMVDPTFSIRGAIENHAPGLATFFGARSLGSSLDGNAVETGINAAAAAVTIRRSRNIQITPEERTPSEDGPWNHIRTVSAPRTQDMVSEKRKPAPETRAEL